MQTNIAGASGKVNYFEADLILTNHRVYTPLSGTNMHPKMHLNALRLSRARFTLAGGW
jgi:hypothetical protein